MMDLVEAFRQRCEVCALLWQTGQFTLHDAVDRLQAAAVRDGVVELVGQDHVQWIMHCAFAPVRDDLIEPERVPDELPEIKTSGAAKATLDAAGWLWFQLGDRQQFRDFLLRHSVDEGADIMQHIKQIEARRHAGNERRGQGCDPR